MCTKQELEQKLKKRVHGELLDLSNIVLSNMDLTGWQLDYVDFSWATFENVIFDRASFEKSTVENSLFKMCSCKETNFREAVLRASAMRNCDLTGAHIEGADLFCTNLEGAKLDGVTYDKFTKYFRLYCPEKGAFLAYKKCVNDRLVRLLVPADAKRSSATNRACRCNKAKVLTIQNFEGTENFTEAWSLVDENFVYRVGEYVTVEDYNEDRWMDSTTGIHFWMTKEDAIGY